MGKQGQSRKRRPSVWGQCLCVVLAQIRARLLRNRLETCTNALPSSSRAWGQLLLMIPLPLAAPQTTIESQGHRAPSPRRSWPSYSLWTSYIYVGRAFSTLFSEKPQLCKSNVVLPEQRFWSVLNLEESAWDLGRGVGSSVAKNRILEKHSYRIRFGTSLHARGLNKSYRSWDSSSWCYSLFSLLSFIWTNVSLKLEVSDQISIILSGIRTLRSVADIYSGPVVCHMTC